MDLSWNEIYHKVLDWLVHRGPGILLGIAVFVVGIFLIRFVSRWAKKGMEKRRVNPSIRYFLLNLFAIVLQILLAIFSLQIAGFELTVFSAIIAGLTVAAGLALSGTLQNFVSGILMLFLKPYRVGDNINTQGQEGTVTEIQLFYTVILTYDHKTIIVPNGQLSNSIVVNLSREKKRRLDIDLRFDYINDIVTTKNLIEQSIKRAKDIYSDPAPRIGVSVLDVERYTITVNVWTAPHGFYDTKMALQELLVNDLVKAGIVFPVK